MPANEFEKRVQESLDELRVKPSDEVWSRVASQISNDKHRRRGFLWLTFLFLIIGSATYWSIDHFYLNKPSSLTANSKIIDKKDAKNSDSEKPSENSQSISPGADDSGNLTNKNQSGSKEKATTEKVKVNEFGVNKNSGHQTATTKKSANPANHNEVKTGKGAGKGSAIKTDRPGVSSNYKYSEPPSKQSANPNTVTAPVENEITTNNENLPSNDLIQKGQSQQAKNANVEGQKSDSKQEKNSVAKTETAMAASKKDNNHPHKKWSLGVTASVGTSATMSSLLPSDKSTSDLYYSNTISNSLTGPYIQGYMYDSNYLKAGISWELGASVKRTLGKRTAISIGFNYHQYNYHTHVGEFVDSPRTFNNTSALVSASGYYQGNGSQDYNNKFGYLELPVSFGYQFNRNENFPIIGEGSLAVGFSLHSNQLTHNFSQNLFYHDDNAINKVTYNLGLGLKFGILNKTQTPTLIGPKFQYAFNDLLKNSGEQKHHLWYLGIEGNISLWNFGGTQRRANK